MGARRAPWPVEAEPQATGPAAARSGASNAPTLDHSESSEIELVASLLLASQRRKRESPTIELSPDTHGLERRQHSGPSRASLPLNQAKAAVRSRPFTDRPLEHFRPRASRTLYHRTQAGDDRRLAFYAGCDSPANSRNSPVTTNTVCSAMSMVLPATRSRQRATRIMNIAHSRTSRSSPTSTARLKISRFSRLISPSRRTRS